MTDAALISPTAYFNDLAGGRQTVTTAGTRVQLSSTDTTVNEVRVQAFNTNTGRIAVGGAAVVEAVATRNGIVLESGDSVTLNITNLTQVWIDSSVNGEGGSYLILR